MLFRAALALALTLALAPTPASATTSAPVPLDGSTAHHALDGIGALSAGASSRLLFDYPAAQRADILDLLFKPSFGASLHMLKVEIGGDAQSTDGSEPSHMHTRDDLSCARGYESWLIAEAKQRNPLIKTYALQWAAPAWVGDGAGNGTGFYSADNHAYLVKWLECVRNTTGATVDYLGTWNEKPPAPPSYVKDLRTALDAAGFGATRISIFDNDYSLNNLVAQAVADADFNASFVSVGCVERVPRRARRQRPHERPFAKPQHSQPDRAPLGPPKPTGATTRATTPGPRSSPCCTRRTGRRRTRRPPTTGRARAAGRGCSTRTTCA